MAVDPNVRHVSLAEVKNILKKAEKDREGELIYEQRIAYDHAIRFAPLPANKIKDLLKDLMQIEGMDEKMAYMIVDILPTTEDDVKALFAKQRNTPKDIKAVITLIDKYYVR